MKRLTIAAALALLAAPPALAQIDPAVAREVFAELNAACRADDGALWGESLCGPTMIIEPASRQVALNQAAAGFEETDGVFVGALPTGLPLANTAVDWNGARWSLLLAPLPDDVQMRRGLLMHESFHRIQPALGLPTASPAPAHLATTEGRVAMRLEWRALGAALIAGDAIALRTAIADALTFRAARRAQAGAQGAEEERLLEMNEGLGEYTGLKLSGAADPRRDASQILRAAEQAPNFARAFAYASGPAYGLLLDELSPDWREGLSADADLGDLLGAVIDFEAPTGDLAVPVQQAASRHGGQEIFQEEIRAAAQRDSVAAAYQSRLVDGPTLTLPFDSVRLTFNPQQLTPLPPHGTVYGTLTVTDAWGELTSTGGALVLPERAGVVVPAPTTADARQGDGWTLRLNEGWRVVAAEGGGFRVERE